MIYGASPAQWEQAKALASSDLLPWIANPSVKMSEASSIDKPFKIPSQIAGADMPSKSKDRPGIFAGEGLGVPGWTRRITRPSDITAWSSNPDHGIGMVCRHVFAIDIDIDDPGRAQAVYNAIRMALPHGFELPSRIRKTSPRRVLLFRLSDVEEEKVLAKEVVVVESGAVEFLFHKQFVALAGYHMKDKCHYEWDLGHIPSFDEVPELEIADIVALIRLLREQHAVIPAEREKEWKIYDNRSIAKLLEPSEAVAEDELAVYLYKHSWVKSEREDGAINVRCPWEDEHSDGPGSESSTVYFPHGHGEGDRGFRCLHAHCADRDVGSFMQACGFEAESFDVVELDPAEAVAPTLRRTKSGHILATLDQIVCMLEHDAYFGVSITNDAFLGQVLVSIDGHIQPFSDNAVTATQLQLIKKRAVPTLSKELTKQSMHLVAERRAQDSARIWLESIEWDRVERLPNFCHMAFNVPRNDYHTAVGNYLWTAMAGRVAQPGVKADMVPVLVGGQGLRKSTLIQSMVYDPQLFGRADLTARDADLARSSRGKLLLEIAELRGLATRDAESIKAWIDQQTDEWVPKYSEFATQRPRRFMLMGTSNPPKFLTDPTGNRRWLPVFLNDYLDIEYVERFRDQLWAEGLVKFRRNGNKPLFADAEKLALPYLIKATKRDAWAPLVAAYAWERAAEGGVTIMEIATVAIGAQPQHVNEQIRSRIERELMLEGFVENDHGKWELPWC